VLSFFLLVFSQQVDNVDHNNDEKYLQSWIADVVLIRDEGDIIRHYQHLEVLDTKVRHQRALVKKVSPGTACEKGPDRQKAEKYMNHLIKLEFQQQQGLLSFKDPGPNTLPVVKAFVTFNNIESFERCVADYDAMWRRAVCCPCAPATKCYDCGTKILLKSHPHRNPVTFCLKTKVNTFTNAPIDGDFGVLYVLLCWCCCFPCC